MRLYVDTLFTSPYAMSAFVALKEKQLDFEVETIDLVVGANRDPAYTKISITQRVPTLVDGDFALSESSAIAEYLDEAYPAHPLFPSNPRDRARARQIQAWLRSDLMPIREERSVEFVFFQPPPAAQPLSSVARVALRKLVAVASEWLQPGADHLFGQWSIADTDLALMLNRLILAGDPMPEHLVRYAAAQWARPSVREWTGIAR